MKTLVLLPLLSLFSFLSPKAQEIPLDDSVVVHPNQRIAISNLAPITSSSTTNQAIAKAAFAIVIDAATIKCDNQSQFYDVVDASTGSLQSLVKGLSGVSCNAGGRTTRVEANYMPNGAIQSDNIIDSIKEGRPLLIAWGNTLYVIYGVVYDERVHNSGRRDNVIRDLLLIDPRYSGKQRLATFERGKDNFAEIQGIASISIGD